MAFNFNWSPLTADADFYRRARDLLTKALNKSPKPPIIVDDILVSEFNLGTVPPDLEILEIGDLAEDRFRGIFKMCYSGDAFMTLKTRVQVRLFISSPSSRGATGSENARSPSAHLHQSTKYHGEPILVAETAESHQSYMLRSIRRVSVTPSGFAHTGRVPSCLVAASQPQTARLSPSASLLDLLVRRIANQNCAITHFMRDALFPVVASRNMAP